MDRLWEDLLEPLCRAARPEILAHVGADRGGVEAGLERYVNDCGATLHRIVGSNRADATTEAESAERESSAPPSVTVHRGLALNVLARLEGCDFVVLDGDPNWFTVTQQLRLLERQAARDQRPFPLVVIRETGRRYARRDGYEDPSIIPDAYRQDYEPARPLHAIPSCDGESASPDARVAFIARGESCNGNGVLTAVEDFHAHVESALDLLSIPGFGGITLLAPQGDHPCAEAIRAALAKIAPPSRLASWIAAIENARAVATERADALDSEIRRRRERIRSRWARTSRERDDALARVRERDETIARLEADVGQLLSDQHRLGAQLALERERFGERAETWARERDLLREAVDERARNAREIQKARDVYEQELEEKEGEVQTLKSLLEEGDGALQQLSTRLHSMERGIESALSKSNDAAPARSAFSESEAPSASDDPAAPNERVRRLELMLDEQESTIRREGIRGSQLSSELRHMDRNLSTVVEWFDRLEGSLSRLLGSKRWKIGNRIGDVHRRLLRGSDFDVAESIGDVLEDYRQWRARHISGTRILRLDDESTTPSLPGLGHHTNVALYNRANGEVRIKYVLETGEADERFRFESAPNGAPLAGALEPGRPSTFGYYDADRSEFLLRVEPGSGAMDLAVRFGQRERGWMPLLGDWNGDGRQTIGLYDPEKSRFLLRNTLEPGFSDVEFRFGPAQCGWIPVVGDWDGDGRDEIGLFDPERSRFLLRFELAEGHPDRSFAFGPQGAGMLPVAGDWLGSGQCGVGLFDPARAEFHLRHTLEPGSADIRFAIPVPPGDWIALTGRWIAPVPLPNPGN